MTELEQVIDRGDRGRKWFLVAVGLVCVGIVAGIAFAIVVNYNQGKQLSKIESPCLKYGPDSKQCEEAFSAAVSTITHPQACAIERKAGTLQAIRDLAEEIGVEFDEPCAGARIAQERERARDRAETRQRATGGDALQTGSTGHQQPGPHEEGGDEGSNGGDPTGGGGNPAPAGNHPPTSQGGGAPAGEGTDSPPAKPKTLPEQATDALEEVTGTVTDAADKVTDDVGETVDEACEHLPPALCTK